MKEKPILFSGPMVRAILAGNKTQTRRVVKPQPVRVDNDGAWRHKTYQHAILCPYGQPGDRLFVRESFYCVDMPGMGDTPCLIYEEEFDIYERDCPHNLPIRPCTLKFGHHPSIHMPRWASRITLEITNIRVERVQDISEADVEWEGTPNINNRPSGSDEGDFKYLWDSINAKRGYGWDVNPFVWVIEFKKITTELKGVK